MPQTSTTAAAFEIKTVPPTLFYYLQPEKPLAELVGTLRSMATGLYVSLAKSGGTVDGPLQLILLGDVQAGKGGVSVQLGTPVRGAIPSTGKFRVRTTKSFKCAAQSFEGSGPALETALAQLNTAVQAAGHESTGEAHIVFAESDNTGTLRLELQIGIR
jgi:hypothetical protein